MAVRHDSHVVCESIVVRESLADGENDILTIEQSSTKEDGYKIRQFYRQPCGRDDTHAG